MYVLAQFSGQVPLDWVTRIRALTSKDEIKHADVLLAKSVRPEESELWNAVDRGIEAATVYVVDPDKYLQHVLAELLSQGAEFGYDFDSRTVIRLAAEQIIKDTPGYQLTNARASLEFATLTASTPMLTAIDKFMTPFTTVPELPVPSEVLSKLGGKLRDAVRFNARSRACFGEVDFEVLDELAPGLAKRMLERQMMRALSTRRVFDTEDMSSVDMLNDTADRISFSMVGQPTVTRPLIREVTSREVDAIQAADIAAGTARELIDKGGVRALANKFRRIFLNGIDLHRILRHSQ